MGETSQEVLARSPVWRGKCEEVAMKIDLSGKRAPLWEIEPEDWTKVIEINLIGTFRVARAGLKRLVAQGDGVFLTISSVHERVPWGGHTAYTATKAACGMVIRSLALELADSGVRALSFAPGAIKTAINKDVWSDPPLMPGRSYLSEKKPQAIQAN